MQIAVSDSFKTGGKNFPLISVSTGLTPYRIVLLHDQGLFFQVVMTAYSISLDVIKQSCIIPLSRDNVSKLFHE